MTAETERGKEKEGEKEEEKEGEKGEEKEGDKEGEKKEGWQTNEPVSMTAMNLMCSEDTETLTCPRSTLERGATIKTYVRKV